MNSLQSEELFCGEEVRSVVALVSRIKFRGLMLLWD